MRILLVSRGFPPFGRYGAETIAATLARGLAARGHATVVFFPAGEAAGEDLGGGLARLERDGLTLFQLVQRPRAGRPFADSFKDRRQRAPFERVLALVRPERVHFLALAGGVSLELPLLAARRGARVSATLTEFLPLCHLGQLLDRSFADCPGPEPRRCARCVLQPGPYDADPRRARRRAVAGRLLAPLGPLVPVPTPAGFRAREALVRRVFAVMDFVHAPSEGLAARYRAFGLPAARIHVFPYGIEGFAPIERRPDPEGGLCIGFAGQIAPHKGPQVLVEALHRLSPQAAARLRVELHGAPPAYGAPRFAEILAARARGLPVRFAGPFEPPELPRVLAGFDCLAIPSLWTENLPLVLLQARVAGLPVLASDVPGLAPFVADGTDGLVLPARDAGAWARAFARLVEDRELRARLARGAAGQRPPAPEVMVEGLLAHFRAAGAPSG